MDHTPLKRVDHTLRRLDVLSKRLQLRVAALPTCQGSDISELQVHIAGDVEVPEGVRVQREEKPPAINTVKERESMYWIVVEMLKEAQKLSEDEALAKKAGTRMDAMMVAGALARVGEAILAGYERATIQPYIDELEDLIEQLKEQLKQTDQERPENPKASEAT